MSCLIKASSSFGVALVVLLLSLAGCGSLAPRPDPSRFFLLTPVAQTEGAGAKTSSNPEGISLGIGPIKLPGYLDRQEIVTRIAPNRLDVAENDRWGEPLEANFTRALSQNLASLLRIDRLAFYPWESGKRPNYQVEVEVLRFESNAAGDAQLAARWSVIDTGTKKIIAMKETSLARQAKAKSTEASVAALSEALGDLSREIADAVSTGAGEKK
jgi:uncharacterized lipoprotein YmbA